MKYIKLQQDLLKAADARDGWKHKPFNNHWFETENQIFICPDAYWMMGIPKESFYLNIDKVFKDIQPFTSGNDLIKKSLDTFPAKDTHMVIDVVKNRTKMKLHSFIVNEETIYVNDNFLKYFDLDESKVTGSGKRSPIYIWEGDVVVGLLLPVNHSKGDE